MNKSKLESTWKFKLCTINDWTHGIFYDELKFNFFPSGNQYARRRKSERYNTNCTFKTVRHSPYLIVWGCKIYYENGHMP